MTSSEFINKFKSKYLWGNIGADSYDDVAKNLENVGYKVGSPDTENGLVQIQNGKDLKEQSFGDYVQVTWDVPEDVKQYADAASGKTISFQLWYGEIEAEEYTPLESLDIDSAMLTYTEELTFPYKSQTKELTINKELKIRIFIFHFHSKIINTWKTNKLMK